MESILSSLTDRVLFAVPKKGRLYEKCIELLAGADVQFTRSNRLDICLVRNHPLALCAESSAPVRLSRLSHSSIRSVFLPASDIPRFVAEGNVSLGITGKDMVAESGVADLLVELQPLGFGKCKLQVQVPTWSSIKTVEDLVGKKVVTSFENVAGQYFAKLDKERQSQNPTTIEYIGGSVEAACALGLADGIVDLVGASFLNHLCLFPGTSNLRACIL
jgi:ATP phosphoribosyltransferase